MKIYSLTNQGRHRTNNQDTFSNYIHPDFTLLILADGMGGQQAGDVASRTAVQAVQDYVMAHKEEGDYNKLLTEAAYEANLQVYQKGQTHAEYYDMGTTLIIVLIEGTRAHIIHVGDSRVYLLREGELSQLTHDHSLIQQLIDKGLKTEEEARTSTIRSILTKAVGVDAEVKGDLDQLELQEGDRLLLCSDGLSDMVTDEEIEKTMVSHESVKTNCEELIALANANGGMDNITVTICEFRSE